MSRTRNPLVVLLLFFVLLCVVPIANTVSSQDEHEAFWKIIRTVQDILAGKNVDSTKATIAKGARLVYGVKYVSLGAVVAGDIKTCSLADSSYHGIAIQAETNPSEDMGSLILKTQKYDTTEVRFHTVVFMKDSTGQFKIISWHTGDCGQ
jgi:hypothetical protein